MWSRPKIEGFSISACLILLKPTWFLQNHEHINLKSSPFFNFMFFFSVSFSVSPLTLVCFSLNWRFKNRTRLGLSVFVCVSQVKKHPNSSRQACHSCPCRAQQWAANRQAVLFVFPRQERANLQLDGVCVDANVTFWGFPTWFVWFEYESLPVH